MPAKYFPGIRARMGRWDYYIVQMNMRDLTMIEFAHQFKEFGGSLSEALQRELNENRAKKQIVNYLMKQPDRFFNAIVIAGFGGEPEWFPIKIEDRPEMRIVADDELMETFGILKMGSKTRYFALDGQHRLLAIKALLDPAGEFVGEAPEDFDQETMAVCLVVPNHAEGIKEFRERFRRLFGHLNRYAKPMDQATNIIMDEDDAVAISLRRLFSDHEFFKTQGEDKDSLRVITTTASKNIPAGAIQLTTISTLYDMCAAFIFSKTLKNELTRNGTDSKMYLRLRPDDSTLDAMYKDLAAIWDGILKVFPELANSGVDMRDNNVTDVVDPPHKNHLLFRPIGQLPFARVVRGLIDKAEYGTLTADNVALALTPLKSIDFDLGSYPWRHLVWTKVEKKDVPGEHSWRITDKPRKKIDSFIQSVLLHEVEGWDPSSLSTDYRELVTLPFGEKVTVDDLCNKFQSTFSAARRK
jgi:DNA sulfur modification protein DndB